MISISKKHFIGWLVTILMCMAIAAFGGAQIIKDIQVLTYDCSTGAWRCMQKGEHAGMPIINSQAANYTVAATDKSGTTFVATTGAVTFTLPAAANRAGTVFYFVNTVAATMTVTAPANTLVSFNNATATSAAFSTASSQIGARVMLWSDGTKWYAFNNSSCTMTVS